MRKLHRALPAVLACTLLTGTLFLAGCSRPTPGPGQQTPAPADQPAGYPAGGDETGSGTAAPGPGDEGYPPPKPTEFDPYPGKTQTAAAGGASGSATETPAAGTEAAAGTPTP